MKDLSKRLDEVERAAKSLTEVNDREKFIICSMIVSGYADIEDTPDKDEIIADAKEYVEEWRKTHPDNPETLEKMKKYESLFSDMPVSNVSSDGVQSETSEDFETCLDNPQNVDEKLAVVPVEPRSEPEMISGPPDGWLRNGVFKKELVQDESGNWYWRTTVDLSELEPPRLDLAYEAALNSC